MSRRSEEMLEYLMRLLKDQDEANAYAQILAESFEAMPAPQTLSEYTAESIIYARFTSYAIACEMLCHIHNHGGEVCVADLIKVRVADLYTDILNTLEKGCVECGLENPLRGESVNARVVKDILAEEARKSDS